MEETNKYYKPELNDLCMGLFYERQNRKGEWIERIINDVSDFRETAEDICDNVVRVKYLSKEDIESLGWIERSQEYEDNFTDLDYKYFTNNNIMRLRLYSDGRVHIHNTHGIARGQKTTWFMGILKNKSELIKILKQTDIQVYEKN